MDPIAIDEFHIDDAYALTEMWRASFEFGAGIKDPHPLGEQIDHLLTKVVPSHRVLIARKSDEIVGFVASNGESISQLYVRVENIGQGIGSRLLTLAKEGSTGSLWLYTFARNTRARCFYENHGFVVVARGFENMWQLEDLKYRWTLGAAASTPIAQY